MKLFLWPSELLDDWALPTETLILSQFHPPFYSCISGAVELVACFCEIYVILIWWGALSRFYLNSLFVTIVSFVKLLYLLLLSVVWSYHICCYCQMCEATIFVALSVVWSYHIRQKYFLLYWLLFVFKTFWYCLSRAIKLPFSKERHVAMLTLSNIFTWIYRPCKFQSSALLHQIPKNLRMDHTTLIF